VSEASSGQEAIDKARELLPDIIAGHHDAGDGWAEATLASGSSVPRPRC
jgi:hypothetical protein